MYEPIEVGSRSRRTFSAAGRILGALKLDGPLLVGLGLIALYGLVVLYSASGQNWNRVIDGAIRAALGGVAMCALAQVKPAFLRRLSLPLWVLGVVLLIVVDITGHIGKGAQRWLDLGFIRFQPSEIMKLAVPMSCAWWLHERPLPPDMPSLAGARRHHPGARRPHHRAARPRYRRPHPDRRHAGRDPGRPAVPRDLRPAPPRAPRRLVRLAYVLYDYQKQRVFTLLDPESDKLGAGYHIIQSQIAIGSGGVFGKGLMNGSQGQLEFLPERTTDFIFAMVGEELGLLGATILLLLYLFVVGRALYLAVETQDTFARLLAGSIALTFFVYVFINAGMVSGLLPVVGVPLPLVSYGGTSMVTLLASFGILMSLYSHRKLVAS